MAEDNIKPITSMMLDQYYMLNKAKFEWFFTKRVNPDFSPRAEEMTQDLFIALLKAIRCGVDIRHIGRYAWSIARLMVKMLYRSADWKARKEPYLDGYAIQYQDEYVLCNLIDNDFYRGVKMERYKPCDNRQWQSAGMFYIG
jgi:DNA-directed RNA polymerase specialized sigma24 family protein